MAAAQKLLKPLGVIIGISLGLTLALTPELPVQVYAESPAGDLGSYQNENMTQSGAVGHENQESIEQNRNSISYENQENNVILILADDLDWETFRNIPELVKLEENNIVFTNHSVTDSLCCPSRASILTGKYVKNHKVYSNVKETGGGWGKYKSKNHHRNNIVNHVKKQNENIKTIFIGKYLNQYTSNKKLPDWDSFITPITPKAAYEGYNYTLSVNGVKRKHGAKNRDYLNTVLTNHALDSIEENKNQQFFMIYSSFLPHSPYEARSSSKGVYRNITSLTKNPDFNATPKNPPSWLKKHKKLNKNQIKKLERKNQKRIEATHTLAQDIEKIINKLNEVNLKEKTTVIITSDNGYHLGNRKLPAGKRTPYYHDTIVPLIIIDPANTTNKVVNKITSSVDLHPSILEYLNLEPKPVRDGVSLQKTIENLDNTEWRNWVLTEANSKSTKKDPDYTKYAPETFKAIRSSKWLYVVYSKGEKELYNTIEDPYEMNNIINLVDPRLRQAIHLKWQKAVMCKQNSCIIN
jgi:arylsulfatase A-like enzyme